MFKYLETVKLDKNLKCKIIDLAEKDKVKILSLSEKCARGNFSCLAHKNDLLRLAVIIETAEVTAEKYKAAGIPLKIFDDTLDDIRIWCENNDNKGLKNYNWIKNHINAELFKIGRLQFQFFKCSIKFLNYSNLPFSYNDNMIYVHIPQGEKLDYYECKKSLNQAVKFFSEYFPDYEYRYFFCESWLLYDKNIMYMDKESNIIKFSSLFDIIYSLPCDFQAIERIYGKRKFNKNKYQGDTSLRKRAKEFMLNGGKLGTGIGIIDKLDLC